MSLRTAATVCAVIDWVRQFPSLHCGKATLCMLTRLPALCISVCMCVCPLKWTCVDHTASMLMACANFIPLCT